MTKEHFTIGPIQKAAEMNFPRREYGSKYEDLVATVARLKIGQAMPISMPDQALAEDPNEVLAFRDKIAAAVRRALPDYPDRHYMFRLMDGGIAIVCVPTRKRKVRK